MVAEIYNADGNLSLAAQRLAILGSLPPAFSWAGSNSVASQAQWLAQAALASQASGKVRLMIVWNIDINSWNAATADTRAGYAIIRPNGSCPACDSLRTVMTARN